MEDKKPSETPKRDLSKLKEIFETGANPLAYIPYADALRRSGALTQALEVCKEGLEKDTFSITGRTLYSRILTDMGRYDQAIEELGTSLQYAPDAFGANLLMAKILAKKREFREAIEILDKIKKLNPDDQELKNLRENIHSQMESMETRGDFLDERGNTSIQTRVNSLLEELRQHPDIASFSFSKMPEENDGFVEHDPAKSLFLELGAMTREKGFGSLNDLLFEMSSGSLLMISLEDSLLKIITQPNVNVGRLRLKVDNLLR